MTDSNDMSGLSLETIAETENYTIWLSHEPDGETVYHVDLGLVTLHLFAEEWQEFNELLHKVPGAGGTASSPNRKRR